MKRDPFAKSRRRRQEISTGELSLAAMVDMMINILIFLLFLYGRGGLDVPPSENMQLAKSTATEAIKPSVTLAVSFHRIEIGGKTALDLVDDHGTPRLPESAVVEGHLPDLTEILTKKREELGPTDPDAAKQPELLFETDRRVPWAVLGPVLRSASNAGFGQYRFIVAMKGDQP